MNKKVVDGNIIDPVRDKVIALNGLTLIVSPTQFKGTDKETVDSTKNSEDDFS